MPQVGGFGFIFGIDLREIVLVLTIFSMLWLLACIFIPMQDEHGQEVVLVDRIAYYAIGFNECRTPLGLCVGPNPDLLTKSIEHLVNFDIYQKSSDFCSAGTPNAKDITQSGISYKVNCKTPSIIDYVIYWISWLGILFGGGLLFGLQTVASILLLYYGAKAIQMLLNFGM